MSQRQCFSAVVLLLVITLLLPTCSSDDKSTAPEPPKLVTLQGTIELPAGATVAPADLRVLCGDRSAEIQQSGAFQSSAWDNAPAVLIGADHYDNPVLMSIVSDPAQTNQVVLNVHSTTLALVFLNPFVCHSSLTGATEILATIESLPAFTILEDAIDQRLQTGSWTIVTDDPVIDQLITDVIDAYVNSDDWRIAPSGSPTDQSLAPSHAAQLGPIIQPNYERSGHRLNWLGGNNYEITNSYGRWAYCCTPTDSFYIFPNGDFLDWIRRGQP